MLEKNFFRKATPRPVLWLTGGTGFLGQNLLKATGLTASFRVISIERHPPESQPDTYTIKTVDSITTDESPKVIVHAATDYGRNTGSIGRVIDANLRLPLQLIDIAGSYLTSFIAIDSYYNKQLDVYDHLRDYCISKRALVDWLGSSRRQLLNLANVC